MNRSYGLYTTIDDRDLTRAASERYALLQISADRRPSAADNLGIAGAAQQLLGSLRSRFGGRGRARTDAA